MLLRWRNPPPAEIVHQGWRKLASKCTWNGTPCGILRCWRVEHPQYGSWGVALGRVVNRAPCFCWKVKCKQTELTGRVIAHEKPREQCLSHLPAVASSCLWCGSDMSLGISELNCAWGSGAALLGERMGEVKGREHISSANFHKLVLKKSS